MEWYLVYQFGLGACTIAGSIALVSIAVSLYKMSKKDK